jgi:multiple sugar transport system substrate-binding protein
LIKGVAASPLLTPSVLAGLAPSIIPGSTKAAQKTLRIMRWKNFVPGFETWFNETFVREWGAQNDTQVIVDNVGLSDINSLAQAQAEAGNGHDLILFLASRPALEDYVIDHREIFEECRSRYGEAADFVVQSCYNPRTRAYHGFGESYAPTVLTFRRDLWDAVGQRPATWDNIRKGGRAIKLLHGAPVGISLAPEHNSKHSIRALMSAFGAAVQDTEGNPVLNSTATLEAIKFAKALYEEAMTDEVLDWGPPSNNRFMLSGAGSMTLDTMSIIRAAENKALPVDPQLEIATLPQGPAGKLGPAFAINTYTIWRFAKNIEGAKKFLIDYIGRFQEGFVASGFQNMPSYTGAVPDFAQLVGAAPYPAGRYSVLADVPSTMTNLGSPGYANAATDEVINKSLLVTMFSRAATGAATPEDALAEADRAIRPIFERWRAAKKI